MHKLDEETKSIIDTAKTLMVKEFKNVEHLLKEIGNKNNTIAKVIGANVFAVGSEMLVLQILENLGKSFLLISTIGLRTLLENFINVHYIYHHPDHLENLEWAEIQCKDYINRSRNSQTQKSRLGGKSLYQRAKIIQFEELYTYVYSELCNYSHFMVDTLDSSVIPFYFKGKTVETAIYTITFYQDILIAISSFYGTPFDVFMDDIFLFTKKGQNILSNIDIKEGYKEYDRIIKNLNRKKLH